MPPAPIVSVDLQGGLGNQMFQYAACHALARRTGADMRLDVSYFARSTKRRYLLDCYAVPAPISHEPSPTTHRGPARELARKVARRLGMSTDLPDGGWKVHLQQGFHFDPAFESLVPPVHLHGYFQSELYFRDVAEEIRKLFVIRVPTSPGFAARRERVAASAWPVSIHVRRGDYVSEPVTSEVHGTCDDAYYRAATSLAERLCPSPPSYFVFSDDIASARDLLRGLKDAVYLGGDVERPWEDIALMSACRGHVIANSSFSWWGAWLAPAADKWVIGPRQWFAPAYQRTISTNDILCPGWIGL